MTTTVAQAHRQLAAEMDEAGDSPEEIAKKLGISVDRVEAILDQLDESDGRPAHQDDEHRAPAVEPVRPEPRPATGSGPIVVGSPARAPSSPKPVVVQPVPNWPPDETTYRPTYLGPDDAPPPTVLAALATQESPRDTDEPPVTAPPCGKREGTRAGYQWHRRRGEDACEPCKEGNRRAQRKPAGPGSTPTPARPAANQARPAPADRPTAAVAHLSLPLAVTALIVVIDALELAYGPGLRVEPADGGLWVMGRAS